MQTFELPVAATHGRSSTGSAVAARVRAGNVLPGFAAEATPARAKSRTRAMLAAEIRFILDGPFAVGSADLLTGDPIPGPVEVQPSVGGLLLFRLEAVDQQHSATVDEAVRATAPAVHLGFHVDCPLTLFDVLDVDEVSVARCAGEASR